MMAEFILPELKISLESQNSDVEALIKIIKPTWNLEKLQTKALHGGYSSRIFQCFDESNPKDSVTIRVRHLADILLNEKWTNHLELKTIQHLSSIGHFPKIYAIFANGYCYQYIEGKSILNIKNRTGFVDNIMMRAIGEEMAHIHSVKLEDEEYSEKSLRLFYEIIFNMLDFDKPTQNGINKRVLLKEHELILNFLKIKNSEIVTCHGDAHAGNYVWNKEQKKVTFVDWEGARIGFQLAEIGNFFLSLNTMETLFLKDGKNRITEDGYKQIFVKSYVETWKKLKKDYEPVSDEEITQWMENIEMFRLEPLFMSILYSFMYPDIFIEFSGLENIMEDIFIKDYLKLKEKIFGKGSFEKE